ncbi:hypothetical protein [Amycolatopsis circi]|uniref:hypothetical protein n=1 Tax=Amycolatopsis circi TaxID=871959 RepID=UPI000E2616A4|nr:hypothetical protein [Amycolatopsis circi]
MADEPLPEHRVAITVFVTAAGVDALDAAHVAECAVRQTIWTATGSDRKRPPLTILAKIRLNTYPVQVVRVMETGMAAGNGYLWTSPTAKPFREFGDEETNRA